MRSHVVEREVSVWVLQAMENACEYDESLSHVLNKLLWLGNVALVGGAVRDFVVEAPEARIAAALGPLVTGRTRLGGFRARTLGREAPFDVWPLQSTWMFTKRPDMLQALFNYPKTVPYSADSGVVSLTSGQFYGNGFLDTLTTGVLKLNVDRFGLEYLESPERVDGLLARSLELCARYSYQIGPCVAKALYDRAEEGLTRESLAYAYFKTYSRTLSWSWREFLPEKLCLALSW